MTYSIPANAACPNPGPYAGGLSSSHLRSLIASHEAEGGPDGHSQAGNSRTQVRSVQAAGQQDRNHCRPGQAFAAHLEAGWYVEARRSDEAQALMASKITFSGDFGRNLEREAMRMAQDHIDKLAKDGTRAADRVLASHGGRSVDVVKPVLYREMKRAGITLSDPELSAYAQQISDGGRVVIKAGRIT